jgi:hypothetical protein
MNNYKEEYLDELENNDVDINEANEIKYDPMSDGDIRYYYPNAKIMTINEISKYKTIDDLLPNNIDYIFILWERSKNNGHWCLIIKDRKNNLLEYFDPYGYYYTAPIYWVGTGAREALNLKPYVKDLLENSNYKVEYNGFDFQSKKDNKMSTCGRHCCLRLKTFLEHNLTLYDYITLMKWLNKKTKMSYDQIVSDLINKISSF